MSELLALDGNILLWVQEYVRADWLTPIMKLITSLGNGGWFWIALSLLLLCFKKTRKAGIYALISLAIGALITNLWLKVWICRTRPYEVVEGLKILITAPHDWSFPSGHTTASFAAGMIYYKTLPKPYGSAALVLAALIALSRLYVGVHYPTDVLGGLLVGIVASVLTCCLGEKYKQYRASKLC